MEPVLIEIKYLKPGTVFRLPGSGEAGYMIMHQRKSKRVLVYMELQGNVNAGPDDLVEIVAHPLDLAAAYIFNLSLRPMVRSAMEAQRAQAAANLGRILYRPKQ